MVLANCPSEHQLASRKDGKRGEAQRNFLFRMTHGRKVLYRAAFLLFPGSKQQLAGELEAAGLHQFTLVKSNLPLEKEFSCPHAEISSVALGVQTTRLLQWTMSSSSMLGTN
ncbi:hypothetical protein E2320_014446, partial [Naja naja]